MPAGINRTVLPRPAPPQQGSTEGGTRIGHRPLTLPGPGLRIRDDWLARTLLNFASDGPDALMHASLMGSDCPLELCQTLLAISPNPTGPVSARESQARTRLDRAFIQGAIRWGRQVTGKDMDRFRRVSTTWRYRLEPLRDWDEDRLKGSMTEDGTLWVLTPSTDCWPSQLDDLSQRSDWAPPLCLWGRGNKESLVSCAQPVAVVGSRTCDLYGSYIAQEIGRQAATQGHLVVSGGAMGADAQAHWGALSARRDQDGDEAGSTVAVFAGGMKRMGPLRNRDLFQSMERHGGALISEMHPETIPEGRRFLLRNRIIAALSSTIVVAQARHRSGALNTANWGAELGREVYAAPGRIDTPENTGCNRLIHQGKATILISATDITGLCHPPHRPGTDPVIASFRSAELPEEDAQTKIRIKDAPTATDGSVSEKNQPPSQGLADKPRARKTDQEVKEAIPPVEEIPPALEYLIGPGDHAHEDLEDAILNTLRSCRKEGEAATVDTLIKRLTGTHSLDQSASPWGGSVQLVIRHLGRLEIEGRIETINGVVHAVEQDQASH